MNAINQTEKKILASLYKLERGSVVELAKDTLINRTTLYPILEKLIEKGLVSKIKLEGGTRFQPISKEEFRLWSERKEKELKEKNQEVLDWIGSQSKGEKISLISDVRYFEGEEGVKNLYADSWRNNAGKIIYAITDYKNAYRTLGDFFRNEYFPQRIKRGVQVKNLLPKSKEGAKDFKERKKFLRDMKFIELFQDLNIEINIYDSKVSIVAFDEKNPTGVLIKNEKIAEAIKNIFEYLWKSVK